MIRMNVKILMPLAFLPAVACIHHGNSGPPPPPNPFVPYPTLDARQVALFEKYPGVTPPTAPASWDSLDLTQRVEYAGGTRVVIKIQNDHKWQAVGAVTKIHGKDPTVDSAQQFNTEVVWQKDAASHFRKLRHWSDHIALLHPGQYGYQENRDGNPFLGMVVLFDENPTDPNQVGGQFHIGFRSFFGHFEAENGDIGDKDNYQLYKRWYGPLGAFEP